MSIIDRDIEFYKAMAEQHRTDLTRCDPSDEPMHRQRLAGAMGVFTALLTYKTTLPSKAGTAPITSLVIALWGCLSLAGCAATGVKVSEDQAKNFQVGRSTYNDVVTGLGAPTSFAVSPNGTRVATYSYSAIQARPQNFIPYIGPLVAGYDTQSGTVNFTFDGHGVLMNTSTSQSNLGTGVGLASGSAQPAAPTAQPR